MTCIVTTVYTRPPEKPRWHTPILLTKELEEQYGAHRMVISSEQSEDDLQLTVKVVWDSQDKMEAFMLEESIAEQYEDMRVYHGLVGIQQVSREVEIVDTDFESFVDIHARIYGDANQEA